MARMSEQAGRYQRSFGALVGALVVLLLLIGVFVVLRDLNRTNPVVPVQAVDYSHPAKFAQQTARFPVLTPRRLPSRWVPTSVRFEDGDEQSWHVGCLTGARRYVGLEEAELPVGRMVRQFV